MFHYVSISHLAAAVLNVDNSHAMHKAIYSNLFYVDALPCIGGTYLIVSIDEMVSCLKATKKEVDETSQDITKRYFGQIATSERDKNDEWEGGLYQDRVYPENPAILIYWLTVNRFIIRNDDILDLIIHHQCNMSKET